MRMWILMSGLALACNNDKGGDDTSVVGTDDTGSDTDDGAAFEDYINVTDPATGDFTGFEGGFDGAGGWWTQTVDSDKQIATGLSGEVEDFQESDPVPDARVDVWYGDMVDGAPDLTMTSDASGLVSGSDVPTCTPVTYKVSTDPDLEETKDTFEAHQIYGYSKSGISDTFNSVSTVTYRLIPGLLGIDPDPAKGIVAGTAYDINGDPIEGAQAIVIDEQGNLAEGVEVKYFIEDFPNRDQPYTSPDGLWVAINIPTGTWTVEMYISDGAGGFLKMGATTLTVEPDSINISNLYTGYGDGVKYPESCLVE